MSHSASRLAGSRPGRRLVEQEQLGRADQAGAEVEPAAHAARVVADEPAAVVGQAELLEHGVGLGPGGPPGMAEQPPDEGEVLPPGQRGLDRGVLAGEADDAAHRDRLLDHVVAGHPDDAGVGPDEGGDGADEGGLARAVGPEQGDELAGLDGQVEAVEGLDGAEALGQAAGVDGGGHGGPPGVGAGVGRGVSVDGTVGWITRPDRRAR